MTRGRPRKPSTNIPAHIDQRALPRGLYFDARKGGCWYVLERDAEGTQRRTNVARGTARLSELHAVMEARRSVVAGSVAAVLEAFNTSREFAELAAGTRKNYEQQRRMAVDWPTKIGPLGALEVDKLSQPFFQRIVDKIADAGTPTKANHLLRYLRRSFAWGINRGHCKRNPCAGVEQATERKHCTVPDDKIMQRMIAFAREAGQRKARTKGSCPPYVWIAAELAYLLRIRGCEVLDLTDASETKDGVRVIRRKGSLGNVTRWAPRLRVAWDAALAYRKATTPAARPVAIDPAKRPLIVAEGGSRLSKSGLDTAWQRLMHAAMESGVITLEQRFGLHAMKHRGITDTEGTRGQKQQASGHKTEAMLDVYDHSVPTVDPTKNA